MSLIVISETFTNGFKIFFLDFVSIISIFFALSIIISKNPVFSVLFLIGLFSTIALYFIMIGLSFIGLSYLLVYVGAVSILFLFILMLINVRISELLTDNKNSVFLAILAVLSFNFPLHEVLPYCVSLTDIISSYKMFFNSDASWDQNYSHENLGLDSSKTVLDYFNSSLSVANVSSKTWDGNLLETNHIASIGNILYTNYFMFLLITSLILLLAMVGAIVITINRASVESTTVDNNKALAGKNNHSFIHHNLESGIFFPKFKFNFLNLKEKVFLKIFFFLPGYVILNKCGFFEAKTIWVALSAFLLFYLINVKLDKKTSWGLNLFMFGFFLASGYIFSYVSSYLALSFSGFTLIIYYFLENSLYNPFKVGKLLVSIIGCENSFAFLSSKENVKEDIDLKLSLPKSLKMDSEGNSQIESSSKGSTPRASSGDTTQANTGDIPQSNLANTQEPLWGENYNIQEPLWGENYGTEVNYESDPYNGLFLSDFADQSADYYANLPTEYFVRLEAQNTETTSDDNRSVVENNAETTVIETASPTRVTQTLSEAAVIHSPILDSTLHSSRETSILENPIIISTLQSARQSPIITAVNDTSSQEISLGESTRQSPVLTTENDTSTQEMSLDEKMRLGLPILTMGDNVDLGLLRRAAPWNSPGYRVNLTDHQELVRTYFSSNPKHRHVLAYDLIEHSFSRTNFGTIPARLLPLEDQKEISKSILQDPNVENKIPGGERLRSMAEKFIEKRGHFRATRELRAYLKPEE